MTSSSRMRYSTVTMIGPLRGSISSATCGSRQRLSGSRSRVASGGSGRAQAEGGADHQRPAAASSACSVPKCTVSQPHTQLPPAMPPKVAIW